MSEDARPGCNHKRAPLNFHLRSNTQSVQVVRRAECIVPKRTTGNNTSKLRNKHAPPPLLNHFETYRQTLPKSTIRSPAGHRSKPLSLELRKIAFETFTTLHPPFPSQRPAAWARLLIPSEQRSAVSEHRSFTPATKHRPSARTATAHAIPDSLETRRPREPASTIAATPPFTPNLTVRRSYGVTRSTDKSTASPPSPDPALCAWV